MSNSSTLRFTKLTYRISAVSLISLFTLTNCGGNQKSKKENFARRIAKESCQDVSHFSNGVVSGIFNQLSGNNQGLNTGTLGELPSNWCDCYTYFVSKDLSEKYSEKELMEINRDKAKKIMAIEKILEVRGEEMKDCLLNSTLKNVRNYTEFAKQLDEKYKGEVVSKNFATQSANEENVSSGSKTTIKIEKVNGVYQIPTEINGIPMYFIFDTGASTISISETETMFLYKQGKLFKEDIIGSANFMDANGGISEGTIIVLRNVKIGNKNLKNIKASVVHNSEAPLLFGQSALEQFGKISIDNRKGEISFE